MYRTTVTETETKDVEVEGAKNVKIQWLINDKSGAKNFAMRRFTIGKDGHTPYHTHDFEHEVLVLNGEGVVVEGQEKKEHSVEKGSVMFVKPDEWHNFKNTGDDDLVILCMIPLK